MPTPGRSVLLCRRLPEKIISTWWAWISAAHHRRLFCIRRNPFNRTVSANLGMSYSISNVLAEAGLENILRWVPFDIDESDLRNRIKNKMIRPTTIPQTLEELKIEQAISREALRVSFEQHKSWQSGSKGVQRERDISEAFKQEVTGETLIDMLKLDLLVGAGCALPRAAQVAGHAHDD